MKKALIYVILLLAFLLRFVSVTKFPVGFNADEASFGYDAYSILHTARDQWGNLFPIIFKSFGDYKSPVYGYLTIPSVAIFGLNVFATRLPNIIVGTLAVLAIYLLVNEIVKHAKWLDRYMAEWLGLVAAFLLAVNPWSVMLSRGAVEANLISFFLPMGIYFFLKGFKENKSFVWSSVFFGINMFTYHSAKFITPIIVLGLVIIFRKQLRKIEFKKIVIPIVLLLIFFTGVIYTFKIGGGSRITERSIVQGALEQGFDERVAEESKGLNPKVAKIFHNKYQVILGRFIYNYSEYFSVKFFVTSGAGDASYAMIPGIGVLNVMEAIFLIGIIPLFLFEKRVRTLIGATIAWLLITPLPGGLSTGIGYSANRSAGMLPVLQIVASFGFFGWFLLIKRMGNLPVKIFGMLATALFIFGTVYFIKTYYKVPSNLALRQELYGSLEVSKWLGENSANRQIFVSRSISEPQIFVAFANKLNPGQFQDATKNWKFDESGLAWVDQLPNYSLENFTIKSIDDKKDFATGGIIVVRADEFKGDQTPIKIFYYPDGTPNIYVVDSAQKTYAKAY